MCVCVCVSLARNQYLPMAGRGIASSIGRSVNNISMPGDIPRIFADKYAENRNVNFMRTITFCGILIIDSYKFQVCAC